MWRSAICSTERDGRCDRAARCRRDACGPALSRQIRGPQRRCAGDGGRAGRGRDRRRRAARAPSPANGAAHKRPARGPLKRDGERLGAWQALAGSDEHGLELWQKLTVYSSHDVAHGGHPLHLAIARGLRESVAAGVTCLRGIWGFHGDHAPHGDSFFQLERRAPVCTITIDRPERIARSFEVIDELTRAHGLLTSELVAATSAAVGGGRHGTLRPPG